jgi:hypothetical protein
MRPALWLTVVGVCLLPAARLAAQPAPGATPPAAASEGAPTPTLQPAGHASVAEGACYSPIPMTVDLSGEGPGAFDPVQPKDCCWHCDFSAEYLYYWYKHTPLPTPLVTTSGNPNDRGVLGPNTTVALFGGSDAGYDAVNGGRMTLAVQCGCCWGVEVSGFRMEQRSVGFTAQSNGAAGTTILAIPFTEAATNTPSSFIVAAPGAASGSVNDMVHSSLWGAEFDVTCAACGEDWWRLGLMAGFRYAELLENLENTTSTTLLQSGGFFAGMPTAVGSTYTIRDSFEAENRFYGPQVGFQATCQNGRWFAGVEGKVALGCSEELIITHGLSALTPPGATLPTLYAHGGVLAQNLDFNRRFQDEFAVMPEVNVSVGCYLGPNTYIFAGYNFLYWSRVFRPGEEVSGIVNSSFVPALDNGKHGGSIPPLAALRSSEFYAQGANLGLGFRF